MQYCKFFVKTNLFRGAAIGLLCTSLAACADVKWLNRLTGEPDESAGQRRAGIERIDNQAPYWPDLGSVPPRPTDLPPRFSRNLVADRLQQDREAGLQLLKTQKEAASQQEPEAAKNENAPDGGNEDKPVEKAE